MPENQNQNLDSQPALRNKVTVDIQTLKKKQQILIHYYTYNQQSQIIQLLHSWPSQLINESLLKEPILHKTNNAKYIGDMCNQMFHGYGLLIYDQPKGRFYEGQFQNNCKHGDGLQFIGGDTYIGKFINNKPEDSNGVFMWKNGDIFIGNFVNGMKHGTGRWQSGEDFYIGTWKYNKPQGHGTIHTQLSEYVGDIKSGYKHGRGIEIFMNGDSYQGLYANGKPEGDGIYKWKNGAIYKGQFKNGIRYGYGQWNFGQQKYEGQYINDRRNGEGFYKWGNESYYKGHFVDDKRHGYGEMHWNQTAFYKGQWRQGIQSGQGQIWEDGKMISKGYFQEGKMIKNYNQSHHNQNNQQTKLIKSRYQKAQKPDTFDVSTKKSHVSSQSRYPQFQKRKKLRSSSYYTNLSQIDENQTSIKVKKPGVTTSFSHNAARNINKNTKAQKSINKFKPQQIEKKQVKETVYLPNPRKKKVAIHKSPASASNYTKQKLSNNHHKSSHDSTPKGIMQFSETQLGPIKWKNFRHMNHPRGSSQTYNLPHI